MASNNNNVTLTADEIKRLRYLIETLNGAIDNLSFDNLINSGDQAKHRLQDLEKEYTEFTGDIDDTRKRFVDLVNEIKNTKNGVSEVTKVYSHLTSITNRIQLHQKGISELNDKEITKLKEKLEQQRQSAINTNALLKSEEEELNTKKESNAEGLKGIQDQIKALAYKVGKSNEEKAQLKELVSKRKELQKEEISINAQLKINKEYQKEIAGIINKEDAGYKQIVETLHIIKKEHIESLDKRFKETINEIQRTDDSIRAITKSYDVLNGLSQKLLDHQNGSAEMSEKDIKNVIKKIEAERKRLANSEKLLSIEQQTLEARQNSLSNTIKNNEIELTQLKAKQTLSEEELKRVEELEKKQTELKDTEDEINKELELNKTTREKIAKIVKNEDETYNKLINKAKELKKQQENIRKASGLGGLGVEGLSKAFSKMGLGGLSSAMGLDEAKEKMKEVSKEVTNGGEKAAGLAGKFKVLGAGLSVIGKNIFSYLTDPLSLVTGIVSGIVAAVKGLISLFEEMAKYNADIAKTYALSASESAKIGDNLRAAAGSDFFMNNEEARKAFDAMATASGTINSKFSDPKALSAMNDMVTFAGYTTEEAGKLYNLGQLNNKSADKMVTSLQGQLKVLQVNNKLRINEKQAVEMVAKASATVRMNLGQNPKALATAAFYATKLGMTLDEISSAAEQTLNFESSIQNQLEYQVLTGKELNIDAYQQAAASGDAAKAAEEMNKILEEQGPNIEKNYFAQEALSKTLGISREQLMKSLEMQKLQKKIGGDTLEIEKAINRKMQDGLSYEEAAAAVSEEGYDSMVKQNQSAEMFSRTISEIKEAFKNALANSKGFKDLFSPANIQKYVDIIQTKIIPFAQKAGELAGKILEYLTDPQKLKELEDKFNKFKDTLSEVAKVAGIVAVAIGGFKAAQMVTKLVMGQPGSSSNPLHVVSAGGGAPGGAPGGGPGGGGAWADKSLGSKVMGGVATAAKVAGIGMAGYTAFSALTAKKEEDITQ